jgi:hypothetical protein
MVIPTVIMMACISLDEGLLKQARQIALDRGISLNELVVTALRLELYRATKPHRKKKITLPTYGGRGLHQAFNWSVVGPLTKRDRYQTPNGRPCPYAGSLFGRYLGFKVK